MPSASAIARRLDPAADSYLAWTELQTPNRIPGHLSLRYRLEFDLCRMTSGELTVAQAGVTHKGREDRGSLMTVAPVKVDWHPGLSIYASKAFLKTVGDEYGWLGGFDALGKPRCFLPFTIIRKPFFRLVRFRVETIPIGEELNVTEEKSFLNSAVGYFRATGADMIIPATTNTIFRSFPDSAIAAPYGTYIIDLARDEDVLLSNLSSSHRRKVRVAVKAGVQILSGIEYLDTAYTLVRDTFKRSALPFMDYETFKRIARGLGENMKIFTAIQGGAVQGCAVLHFSDYCAYYAYGGSIPEPSSGAMHFLHWEAIKFFKHLGVKRYDFVGGRISPEKGSKQEGIMTFKERFGGELTQGFMWKCSFHFLKYSVYSLAVRLQRGGDIVDQERRKMANLAMPQTPATPTCDSN